MSNNRQTMGVFFFLKINIHNAVKKTWLLKSGECLKWTKGQCKRGRFITLCSNSILRLKWEEYVNYHDHNNFLFIPFRLCCSNCVTSLRMQEMFMPIDFKMGMSELRNFRDERNRTCNCIGWQWPNRQLLHQGLTGIKHKYQSLLDLFGDHKPVDLTLA